jgi:hypothetical protein
MPIGHGVECQQGEFKNAEIQRVKREQGQGAEQYQSAAIPNEGIPPEHSPGMFIIAKHTFSEKRQNTPEGEMK